MKIRAALLTGDECADHEEIRDRRLVRLGIVDGRADGFVDIGADIAQQPQVRVVAGEQQDVRRPARERCRPGPRARPRAA